MLRFSDHDDYLEIAIVTKEDDAVPSHGDVYLAVRVSSAGFSGRNDLWVVGTEFEAFRNALVRLEKERKGEATLSGVDPRELAITVRSVDSKGHMIVEGHTGYGIRRDVTMSFHSVTFGIEFDPFQLDVAIKALRVENQAQPARPDNGG